MKEREMIDPDKELQSECRLWQSTLEVDRQ